MKSSLLTAVAIAFAMGMEDKQKWLKGKIIPENPSSIRAAIQKARNALERGDADEILPSELI